MQCFTLFIQKPIKFYRTKLDKLEKIQRQFCRTNKITENNNNNNNKGWESFRIKLQNERGKKKNNKINNKEVNILFKLF